MPLSRGGRSHPWGPQIRGQTAEEPSRAPWAPRRPVLRSAVQASHDPQSSAESALSRAWRWVPPRERGACARARVPLLDARSRFRLRLPALSRSPKCGPRAQLSWARPLPDAHVRVQLSSMFPPLRGRSLLQRGVGLGRGRGQCPAGAAPPPTAAPLPRSHPGPFLSTHQ